MIFWKVRYLQLIEEIQNVKMGIIADVMCVPDCPVIDEAAIKYKEGWSDGMKDCHKRLGDLIGRA
jgi:hypothetical protein